MIKNIRNILLGCLIISIDAFHFIEGFGVLGLIVLADEGLDGQN